MAVVKSVKDKSHYDTSGQPTSSIFQSCTSLSCRKPDANLTDDEPTKSSDYENFSNHQSSRHQEWNNLSTSTSDLNETNSKFGALLIALGIGAAIGALYSPDNDDSSSDAPRSIGTPTSTLSTSLFVSAITTSSPITSSLTTPASVIAGASETPLVIKSTPACATASCLVPAIVCPTVLVLLVTISICICCKRSKRTNNTDAEKNQPQTPIRKPGNRAIIQKPQQAAICPAQASLRTFRERSEKPPSYYSEEKLPYCEVGSMGLTSDSELPGYSENDQE